LLSFLLNKALKIKKKTYIYTKLYLIYSLVWDIINKQECIVLATDLDGDRLTDLLADISDPLRDFGTKIRRHGLRGFTERRVGLRAARHAAGSHGGVALGETGFSSANHETSDGRFWDGRSDADCVFVHVRRRGDLRGTNGVRGEIRRKPRTRRALENVWKVQTDVALSGMRRRARMLRESVSRRD